MTPIVNAVAFFHACESAQAWDECRKYSEPDASFRSAAATYNGTSTLEEYCDQIAAVFNTTFRGSDYELLASAYDAEKRTALLSGMSYAKRTGESGSAPTHKEAAIPFVYSLKINDEDMITHLEKIYDHESSSRQLGFPNA